MVWWLWTVGKQVNGGIDGAQWLLSHLLLLMLNRYLKAIDCTGWWRIRLNGDVVFDDGIEEVSLARKAEPQIRIGRRGVATTRGRKACCRPRR